VRIRPTELGWKGLLLLGGLEIAFLATAYSNLFFLLIAFCCVVGGLGALWSLHNLHRVDVVRIETAAGPAGHPRDLRVTLTAPGRPRYDVAVQLCRGSERLEVAHAVRWQGSIQLDGTLPARPRGIETMRVRLRSTFPFGLFAVSRDSAQVLEIVSHPDPGQAGAAAARHPRHVGGDQHTPDGARSASVAGLRPFRTGDALGDVHWKATARRGSAVVKERERDGDLAIDLVLDRRGSAEGLELALAVAAAHVLTSDAEATPLRLQSQDARFVLGADRGHAALALRWLAGAEPLPLDAPPPPAAPGAIRLGGARTGGGP
jgi:uncharacterized protein (DUF58 family)